MQFGKSRMMPMNTNSVLDEQREREIFESVTDEEILYLWRSIKGRRISENEAWNAVMAGLALDVAFANRKPPMQIEQ